MYIEELLTTFRNITKANYPELNTEDFLNDLKSEIEKKKFDLQDQTIIENILRGDIESFSESFLEILETTVADSGDKHSFFNNENDQHKVILLFIKSVEHSIDYFYNDIISKQLSGK